ncbi:MAG: hypothetical protein ACYDEA_10335 [Candidatus Dormibacteria bacterium]
MRIPISDPGNLAILIESIADLSIRTSSTRGGGAVAGVVVP